jgi:hypothetical protein
MNMNEMGIGAGRAREFDESDGAGQQQAGNAVGGPYAKFFPDEPARAAKLQFKIEHFVKHVLEITRAQEEEGEKAFEEYKAHISAAVALTIDAQERAGFTPEEQAMIAYNLFQNRATQLCAKNAVGAEGIEGLLSKLLARGLGR